MTLKQQNELTLKRIELQMIEDYFSKEARNNRKQHGQKSSGQMKAILLKYDFEKWLTVVWDDTMTKEFKTALSNIYISGIKTNIACGIVRDKEGQPEFTWKTEGFSDYFTVELTNHKK